MRGVRDRDRDRDGFSASAAQLAGRPRGVSILRARTMSDWEESEEPSTVPVPSDEPARKPRGRPAVSPGNWNPLRSLYTI